MTLLVLSDRMSDVLAGYQAGDARAFCEFHSALRPLLASHLRSLGTDEADLDGLLDRVFLQIHAARSTWRPGSPLEPWLTAIAEHVRRLRNTCFAIERGRPADARRRAQFLEPERDRPSAPRQGTPRESLSATAPSRRALAPFADRESGGLIVMFLG